MRRCLTSATARCGVNEVYLDAVDAETMSADRLKVMGDEAIAAVRDRRSDATNSVER